MKYLKVFVLLLIAEIFSIAEGYKILGVFPTSCKSHWIIGHSVMKSLANAGHEVYVISPFPLKEPMKNYNDIVVENNANDESFNIFLTEDWTAIQMINFLSNIGENIANATLSDRNVQNFLLNEKGFDVVINEVFWVEALFGFGAYFNCPVIALSTFSSSIWTNKLTLAPMAYSYVAHNFVKFSENMNFLERTINTLTSQYENIFMELIHYERQRNIFDKHFSMTGKSFYNQMKTISLVFINHHFSTSSIRPMVANMIEIGGIHVQPPKALPKDIQEFLDSANDGAILFSMGSIIKGKDWPIEKRESFVKTFKNLKEKIIWKYENETLPNKPDNVMIGSWIPQRDILAHPNVKLFITHGGLLGTTEAVVEGVPVLGIPIYADQKMNMLKAEAYGYGVLMNLNDIDDELVGKNINKLLTNQYFRKNAKTASNIYNDRPLTPQQLTVYWTEYIIRHEGAKFLQSPAHKLNFIQRNLIDVYFFLIASYVLILFIIVQLIKFSTARLRNIFIKKSFKVE